MYEKIYIMNHPNVDHWVYNRRWRGLISDRRVCIVSRSRISETSRFLNRHITRASSLSELLTSSDYCSRLHTHRFTHTNVYLHHTNAHVYTQPSLDYCFYYLHYYTGLHITIHIVYWNLDKNFQRIIIVQKQKSPKNKWQQTKHFSHIPTKLSIFSNTIKQNICSDIGAAKRSWPIISS